MYVKRKAPHAKLTGIWDTIRGNLANFRERG